jgi:hypothetical protein
MWTLAMSSQKKILERFRDCIEKAERKGTANRMKKDSLGP